MAPSPTGGPLERAAAEAVRRYVDAVKAGPPPASRRVRAAAQRRLAEIEDQLTRAPPMHELVLVQERHDLLALAAWYDIEDAFVAVARVYGRRHGIAHRAWREVGVPDAVLRRAGIRPATPDASQLGHSAPKRERRGAPKR
jgi:hypothetical protein